MYNTDETRVIPALPEGTAHSGMIALERQGDSSLVTTYNLDAVVWPTALQDLTIENPGHILIWTVRYPDSGEVKVVLFITPGGITEIVLDNKPAF
ncbi:hypothetical protein OG339_48465 (plasmid) [Streptosporangium sp. NBC_01495]|uniref:hypothetical protein n=1 Tax=Streptosporangium sp. NBC_01495 TaxID=2903899 RepID=UPI002E2FF619|nr:hypothetical protein [Streptosporangium sp. NBC_01495]